MYPITAFKYFGHFTTIIITIAAITTPLRLCEIVEGSSIPSDQVFRYVPDAGVFGEATTSRQENVTWRRLCGLLGLEVDCPGSATNVTYSPTLLSLPLTIGPFQ